MKCVIVDEGRPEMRARIRDAVRFLNTREAIIEIIGPEEGLAKAVEKLERADALVSFEDCWSDKMEAIRHNAHYLGLITVVFPKSKEC